MPGALARAAQARAAAGPAGRGRRSWGRSGPAAGRPGSVDVVPASCSLTSRAEACTARRIVRSRAEATGPGCRASAGATEFPSVSGIGPAGLQAAGRWQAGRRGLDRPSAHAVYGGSTARAREREGSALPAPRRPANPHCEETCERSASTAVWANADRRRMRNTAAGVWRGATCMPSAWSAAPGACSKGRRRRRGGQWAAARAPQLAQPWLGPRCRCAAACAQASPSKGPAGALQLPHLHT